MSPRMATQQKAPRMVTTVINGDDEPRQGQVAEAVSLAVEDARASLLAAAQAVTKATNGISTHYGDLVEAVAKALAVNMPRQAIAEAVAEGLEATPQRRVIRHTNGREEEQSYVTKGKAARYIMLARWERGEFAAGEATIRKPIDIGGKRFTKPVAALRANVASFTKVFTMFREAVRPPVVDFKGAPADPSVAIEEAVLSLGFRVKARQGRQEVFTTLRPSESTVALTALLAGVLKLTTTAQVLPEAVRDGIAEALKKASRGQAKVLTLPAKEA